MTAWKKMFSPYEGDRVIYIIYKEILLTNKEQSSIQKWAKDKNRQFTQEKKRNRWLNLTTNHKNAN